MGLFGFLRRNKEPDDSATSVDNKSDMKSDTKVDKSVARLGRVAGSKQAQTFDRMDAIRSLSTIGTADSAAALLKRFSFYIDPSITDQEEKEIAFHGIVAAGLDAIEPIREFCVKAESFTWPMKMLAELLDNEAYLDELLVLLGRFDTDYAKKQEPKLQIIAELEGKQRDDITDAVLPFLDDFDERVRFHSVSTLLSQHTPRIIEPLCQLLGQEESVRIRNRIYEGFATHQWAIPEQYHSDIRAHLTDGYDFDGQTVKQR